MCIVIDTNVLSCVFDRSNPRHGVFQPVLDWIIRGEGKIVFGGTTYEKEVLSQRKYLSLFAEFSRQRKTVSLPKEEVDRAENDFVRILSSFSDFDDPHLLALFHVSGCLLLCSDDKRADRFVKSLREYSRIMKRKRRSPKIYREVKHRHLLCSQNVAKCCLPTVALGAQAKRALSGLT